MNAEATELNVVEEVIKTDEAREILALSFEDLDLVGGGAYVGVLG